MRNIQRIAGLTVLILSLASCAEKTTERDAEMITLKDEIKEEVNTLKDEINTLREENKALREEKIAMVNAWKNGADRSNCILNIRNFQVAIRSYANMNGKGDGDSIAVADLVGPNNFISAFPVCPSGGTYTPAATDNVIYTTSSGKAFLKCDCTLGGIHAPNSTDGW